MERVGEKKRLSKYPLILQGYGYGGDGFVRGRGLMWLIPKRGARVGCDGISLVIKSWPGAPLVSQSIVRKTEANAIVDTFFSFFLLLFFFFSQLKGLGLHLLRSIHGTKRQRRRRRLKSAQYMMEDYVGREGGRGIRIIFLGIVEYAVVRIREEKTMSLLILGIGEGGGIFFIQNRCRTSFVVFRLWWSSFVSLRIEGLVFSRIHLMGGIGWVGNCGRVEDCRSGADAAIGTGNARTHAHSLPLLALVVFA